MDLVSEGAEVIKDSLIYLPHAGNLLSAYNGLGAGRGVQLDEQVSALSGVHILVEGDRQYKGIHKGKITCQGRVGKSIVGLTLIVSLLSGTIVLHRLLSNKPVVQSSENHFIYFIVFQPIRWKGEFTPCYSIMARSGSDFFLHEFDIRDKGKGVKTHHQVLTLIAQ